MERHTIFGGSEDSLSIVRMKIFPKLIYTFNAIPIKILLDIPKEMNNLILEFLWQCKGTRLRKTTMRKNKVRGSTLPGLESHHNKVTKRLWYWHQEKEVDQWIRLKHPEINLHIHEKLIFDKGSQVSQWYATNNLQKLVLEQVGIYGF